MQKHLLFLQALLILVLFAGQSLAQDNATQLVLQGGGSPAVLTDAFGKVYFTQDKTLKRINPQTQAVDELFTFSNSTGYPVQGLAFGAADSIIYMSFMDSIFVYSIKQNKTKLFWSGRQYPSVIAYNKATNRLYAMEKGFDNGRNSAIVYYDPATGERNFVAGVNSIGNHDQLPYVNSSVPTNVRFNFRSRRQGERNRGALAFNLTEDTLLIGDVDNFAIRWLDLNSGAVGTFAGPLPDALPNRGYKDGARYDALFNDIMALAVDNQGNVIVGDAGGTNQTVAAGNRIRKIDPNGRVYTLAGNGIGWTTGSPQTIKNQDFFPGFGTNAQIGLVRGFGFNKNRDTLYAALSQRIIRLAKRNQVVTFNNFNDRLVGSGKVGLSATSTFAGPVALRVVSAPAGVNFLDDTLDVTEFATPGVVTIEASREGNDDSFYPVTVTKSFRIKAMQGLTLKPVADKVFGAAPFSIKDSASLASGLPVRYKLVKAVPAGSVTFDSVASTFTINRTGQVIYRVYNAGNDTIAPVERIDTFNINKAPQPIIIDSVPNVEVGAGLQSITASISPAQGQTIRFSIVSAPANVTILQNPARINVPLTADTGLVVVKASVASSTNYLADSSLISFKVVSKPVSIATASKGIAVAVYPNPASDVLHIAHAQTGAWVEIGTLTGQVLAKQILSGPSASVSLSSLPTGILIVKVHCGGTVAVKRIIKQ